MDRTLSWALAFGPRASGFRRRQSSAVVIGQPVSPPPTAHRPPPVSQTQCLELLEHLGDAPADHLAFVAQGRELDSHALGFGEPCVGHIELAREPLIFLRQPGLVAAEPLDHADELPDLLFETINRFEINSACHRLGHYRRLRYEAADCQRQAAARRARADRAPGVEPVARRLLTV